MFLFIKSYDYANLKINLPKLSFLYYKLHCIALLHKNMHTSNKNAHTPLHRVGNDKKKTNGQPLNKLFNAVFKKYNFELLKKISLKAQAANKNKIV